jgi:hypothetical protein
LDKVLSEPNKVLSVTDKGLSVTDKGLSKAEKVLSKPSRTASKLPKVLVLCELGQFTGQMVIFDHELRFPAPEQPESLPDTEVRAISHSGEPLAKAPGVKFVRMEGDRAVLEVEAGNCRLATAMK